MQYDNPPDNTGEMSRRRVFRRSIPRECKSVYDHFGSMWEKSAERERERNGALRLYDRREK